MSSRTRALIIGIASGAIIGAVFGWIVGDAEEEATPRSQIVGLAALGPGDYLKIGIAVLALAREVNAMMRRV